MRIFLVDDQVMVRQGIRSLLERTGTYLISGESKMADQAVNRIRDCGADIILLDAGTCRQNTLPASVSDLKQAFPGVAVVVVSRHIDPITVREALAAGADGFLPKDADSHELFRALTVVENGGCFIHADLVGCVVDEFRKTRREPAPEQTLTDEERRLIEFVSQGRNNKWISDELYVSVSTVKNHLRSLFRKFKVSDRTQLVVEAMNRGVLSSRSHGRDSNAS